MLLKAVIICRFGSKNECLLIKCLKITWNVKKLFPKVNNSLILVLARQSIFAVYYIDDINQNFYLNKHL